MFFRGVDLARTITTCPACQARLTFNKEGKCALIKSTKYAREDPKHVRTYFNELKQHKVAFRTRMQWLSRIYGGRGGYTSEELYKIVTGKTVGGYYIFPFVKGAPPEVNRILERTYRTHREAGDTKVAAAIAAWTKVKQAGYVKQVKPAPVWVKRRYNMEQLRPIQSYTAGPRRLGKPRTKKERLARHKKLHPVTKLPPRGTGLGYGLGAGMGGLAERGVRGMWGAVRRHPRITRGAGAFGVGYLTHKELAKRRKRKKGYQLGLEHLTPDIPLSRMERLRERLVARKPTKKGLAGVGKRLGGAASMAVKTALIGLAAKEVLDLLAKRKPRAPWLPEVRADIELSGPGYEALSQVVQYAAVMPSKVLRTIQTKANAALRKTKRGVERGFLLWLLGFISSELLGRGISKPQRRHEVVFPEQHQLYARFRTPGGVAIPGGVSGPERLPRWGYQPFSPTKTKLEPLPKFKRPRRLGRKLVPLGALPLAALLALRLSKRRREGYSFRTAASKTLRGVKKVGGGIGKVSGVVGKGLGKVYPAAMTALIVSEFWPRKRKLPTQPPVQPYTRQTLAAVRHAREIALQKIRLRMTRTRAKQALKLRGKRVGRGMFQLDPEVYTRERAKSWAESLLKWKRPPKGKKGLLDQLLLLKPKKKEQLHKHKLIQMYPFKSAAQRRWMHWKKPKMAKEWEEHTPEGKELPEHVSKHLLGVPVITPLIIATLLARKKAQKKKQTKSRPKPYALAAMDPEFLRKLKRAGFGAKRRRLSGLVPGMIIGGGLLALHKRRKAKVEAVSKHALQAPLLWRHLRGISRLHKARALGRDITKWGGEMAARMRKLAASTTGQRITIKGVSVSAPAWFGKEAAKWDHVAAQAKDMILKGQLEKVGLLATGTAAGIAAHEVGKKRERARVRKLVG